MGHHSLRRTVIDSKNNKKRRPWRITCTWDEARSPDSEDLSAHPEPNPDRAVSDRDGLGRGNALLKLSL